MPELMDTIQSAAGTPSFLNRRFYYSRRDRGSLVRLTQGLRLDETPSEFDVYHASLQAPYPHLSRVYPCP